jgi:DNA-binding NtrC family response regulator
MIVFQDAGQTTLDVPGGAEPDALLRLPLREARQQIVERFEQAYIEAQLKAHGGNVTRAAEAVGVSRQFLHRLMERYRTRGGDAG